MTIFAHFNLFQFLAINFVTLVTVLPAFLSLWHRGFVVLVDQCILISRGSSYSHCDLKMTELKNQDLNNILN